MCILPFYLFSKILKNYFFFFLVEIDDLKKITNSLTVLCSEKQKQEKVKELGGKCVLHTHWGVDMVFSPRLVRRSHEFTNPIYTGIGQGCTCHYHPFVYRYVHVFLK